MEKLDLKPCPFCGGQGKVMIPTGRYLTFYVVMCEECRCRTKEFPDKEMAVEVWDRRSGGEKSEQEEIKRAGR